MKHPIRFVGIAGVTILALSSVGCASSGRVDTLEKRVDSMEQKVGQAVSRAEAAEKRADEAALRAEEAARTSEAIFQKTVRK